MSLTVSTKAKGRSNKDRLDWRIYLGGGKASLAGTPTQIWQGHLGVKEGIKEIIPTRPFLRCPKMP